MIEAHHLIKSYRSRRVLQRLDLTVKRGEIVALVGHNGVGKTTLIRILATLARADAGSVHIDGISTASDAAAARQKIGVVLHSPMAYANLSARENLRFFSRLYDVPNPDERIEQLLEEFHLSSRTDELVRTFSRGMQGRLTIARALLHRPDCLMMDEPYTGLDHHSARQLDALLKKKLDEGISILMATHDLERIFDVATRVDVLHQGKIVFSSPVCQITPQQLLEQYQAFNPALDLPFAARGSK